MSYKGETFKYDSLGNPTTYKGVNLTWSRGRQLVSYGDKASYTYNVSGIRTSKQVGNTTTNYFLDGTRILAQVDTVTGVDDTTVTTTTEYIYGADGITGFVLNGAPYYYKKNLQGDIIAILDKDLQIVTKYTYDAWGNCKTFYLNNGNFVDIDSTISYTESNAENAETVDYRYIAIKNPFRYRGYYYDVETGLYYLNSRYYDPETGRFINIDDISVLDITNIAVNGLNLYAYCLNNPVNEVDRNGNIVSWLLAIIVGAVVGAFVNTTFEIVNQVKTNGWNPTNWDLGKIGLAFLGGAVAGAISAIPIPGFQALGGWGKILHYGLTFVTGSIGAVSGGLISGSITNIETGLITASIGGVFNLLSSFVTTGLNNIAKKYANKILTNSLYADMTLGDLIGSGLKNYPKSLSTLMSKLSRAVIFANGGLPRSIMYMIGLNFTTDIISGLI